MTEILLQEQNLGTVLMFVRDKGFPLVGVTPESESCNKWARISCFPLRKCL